MTGDFGVKTMQAHRASAEVATYPETLGELVDRASDRHGDALLAKWLESGRR